MFLASVLTQQRNCKKQLKKFKAFKRLGTNLLQSCIIHVFSLCMIQLLPTVQTIKILRIIRYFLIVVSPCMACISFGRFTVLVQYLELNLKQRIE